MADEGASKGYCAIQLWPMDPWTSIAGASGAGLEVRANLGWDGGASFSFTGGGALGFRSMAQPMTTQLLRVAVAVAVAVAEGGCARRLSAATASCER